jgi:hypothetical protein
MLQMSCSKYCTNNIASCPAAVLWVHMPGFTTLRSFRFIELFNYYFVIATIVLGSLNNLVGTYSRLRERGLVVRSLAETRDFSFHHGVQPALGYSTSFRKGTDGPFPRHKAVWAWSRYIHVMPKLRMHGDVLPHPSWRDAELSTRITSPIIYAMYIYRYISGVCVTNKTGFLFDDRIYLTFIKLVTTFHKSLSSTGYSRLLTTLLLQLNWIELRESESLTVI